MNRTLEMMNGLANNNISIGAMSLEEISRAYRGDKSPLYLAHAFKKVYKLILSTSRRFYGLNDDDIASLALERLDMCLLTYEIGQAVFSTYFTTVLSNKFREETQALNTHKRKTALISDSYDLMVENGYDLGYSIDNEVELFMVLDNYDLTENESRYCVYVVKSYDNKTIAEKLGVSTMTISNIRKKLKFKLAGLAL